MLRLIVAWIVAVANAIAAAYIAVLMYTQIKNRRNQVQRLRPIAIKPKAIKRAGTTETWSGKIIYLGDDLYAMVPINRPYKHGKKI